LMAEHESSIGATSDWYTPKAIFDALKLTFDLDPCSPGTDLCHVPARRIYTKTDDGLRQPWPPGDLVFMNPPFGGRNGHVPWLIKFLDHGNGIAIVRPYTSSSWWHEHVVPRGELLCFPKGKTKFVRPDGSIGAAPGHGVALIGMGAVACTALHKSGLGFCAVIVAPGRADLLFPFDWAVAGLHDRKPAPAR
jgi:DNA N-6-adenine-methyltransferase (Dam)